MPVPSRGRGRGASGASDAAQVRHVRSASDHGLGLQIQRVPPDRSGLHVGADTLLPAVSNQAPQRRAVRAKVSPMPAPGQRQNVGSARRAGDRDSLVGLAVTNSSSRPPKDLQAEEKIPIEVTAGVDDPGGGMEAAIMATSRRATDLVEPSANNDVLNPAPNRARAWLRSLQLQPKVATKADTSKPGYWEWQTDDEEWDVFADADAQLLEEAVKAGEHEFETKELTYNYFDAVYKFDFVAMTQVNLEFGTSRKIRRTAGTKAKLKRRMTWDRKLSHSSLEISEGGRTVSGEKEDWRFTDNTRAAFSREVMQAGELEIVFTYLGGMAAFLCAGVCLEESEHMRDADGKLVNMWNKVDRDSTRKACYLYSFYYTAYSRDHGEWENFDGSPKEEWEENDQLVLRLSAAPSSMDAYFRPQGKVAEERRIGCVAEGLEGKIRVIALLGGDEQKLRLGSEVPVVRLTRAAALGLQMPKDESLPPWIERTRSKASRVISDTAQRGMTLKQLRTLADMVHDALHSHEVFDSSPFSAHRGDRITWKQATMYHVCEHFVLPMTKAARCSMAELVATDVHLPQWMISHAWSTRFACTMQMLNLHATSRSRGDCSSNVSYWICTMANNQHDLSEISEKSLLDTPFARVLQSKDCIGTVVLCDQDVTPLKRVWCVFEVKVTETLRNHTQRVKERHYLDVIATSMEADPATDSASQDNPPRLAAAMLQDALQGNFHEVSDAPGIHFPLQVALIGTQVDIAQAQASIVEDRNAILNYVALHEAVKSSAPPTRHPEYDNLNIFVHSIFASAELYRVAAEKPDGCLESMERLLKLHADPNKHVRAGNTTLFAVVGADPVARAAGVSADEDIVESMLTLLLGARADPNSVNEEVKTVLDFSDTLAQPCKDLLLSSGAKPFIEVADVHESFINASLEEMLTRGFPSEGESFGGSGGGGDPTKLLGSADRYFEEAAMLVKRYPTAVCWLETLATRQDRLRRRPAALKKLLEQYGCHNTIHASTVDRGPLVSVRLAFVQAGDSALERKLA